MKDTKDLKLNFYLFHMTQILVFSVLLLSCHRDNSLTEYDKGVAEIFVPIDKNHIKLTDIVDTLEYVQLSSGDSSIIGEIDKITADSSRIYLLDFDEKSLFVFESSGKFLFKIKNIGKGPGEYESMDDYFVSEKSGNIIIYSDLSEKLLVYSSEGKFLKEIPTKSYLADFCGFVNPEKFILYTSEYNTIDKNKSYHINLIDANGKSTDQFLPVNEKRAYLRHSLDYALTETYEGYNIILPFHDTIYSYLNNTKSVEPAYRVRFNSKSAASLLYSKHDTDDLLMEIVSQQTPFLLGQAWETEKYLIFNLSIGESVQPVFWNKSQNRLFTGESIRNDIDSIPLLLPKGNFEEYMIFIIPVDLLSQFRSYLAEREISGKKYSFEKLISRTTDNTNPIIVFAKLK